jgi:hypothetical protein
MNKIGGAAYEGGGIEVYQDGDRYFYYHIEENCDEIAERYSEYFDSLEDLLASLPKGIHYNPAGSYTPNPIDEITPEYLARAAEFDRRLRETHEERLREYGTTDFQKLLAIEKARKANKSSES